MKNRKKTDDFLAALKEAGLSKSFEKICMVASKTIGCDLEDLIDDMVHQMENPAPELTPVWRIKYQDRWLATKNEFWWLNNHDAKHLGAIHDFPTAEAAKMALDKEIRDRSKGTRTLTDVVGGIGVDLVIDEKSAEGMEIVHWKLVHKYVSKWEVVEEV